LFKEKNTRNKIIFSIGSKLLSSPTATFFLDPFIPKIASFYLNQNFKKWKSKGILESYQFDVQRTERLTYKICLHVLAKKKETQKVIADYLEKYIGAFMKGIF
jgi:hypothetical protein